MARRTYADLVLLGLALGAFGILPDLDHLGSYLIRGQMQSPIHSPVVLLALAGLWALGLTALAIRWNVLADSLGGY